MHNNLQKVQRVLQKTNFVDNLNLKDLEAGNPSQILKIVHHLVFRASESFTRLIQSKLADGMTVHQDIKFMPDISFYKNICLILCDLFGYRTNLTPNQFFSMGFSEPKIVFVLDLYDIIKQVRKGIKINERLTKVQYGVPHASDEAIKEYSVINHKENKSKTMVFKINP